VLGFRRGCRRNLDSSRRLTGTCVMAQKCDGNIARVWYTEAIQVPGEGWKYGH
jgi:hypothetical protein